MEILKQIDGKDVRLISPDKFKQCKNCSTLMNTPDVAIEKGYALDSKNTFFCTGEEAGMGQMEVQGDLIGGEKRYDAKLEKYMYGRNAIFYTIIDCPALRKS